MNDKFFGQDIRSLRAANIYQSYLEVEALKKSKNDNIVKSNTFLSPQLIAACEDEVLRDLILGVKKNIMSVEAMEQIFKSEGDELDKAFEELDKGEIFDALAASNGGDDKTLVFNKTGKDVKEKIKALQGELETTKSDIVAKMAGLEQTIGIAPDSERISYSVKTIKTKRYSWRACDTICSAQEQPSYMPQPKPDPTYDAKRKAIDEYNDFSYELEKVAEDLEAIRIADANIEEGKNYKFNIRQLSSLGF